MQDGGSLFVITGGPGSGKTSVIEALAARGYRTTVEAGRSIIREQLEVAGQALPWSNAAAFAELMLAREIQSYHRALATSQLVFFDRGIPDVIGFLRLMSLPVPPLAEQSARDLRYDRSVFIAPPWKDIFEQDAERRQTFTQAVATYEAMVGVYTHSGYDLLPLPRASVGQRVEFVLDSVKAQTIKA
jgi:predicted ATPase